MKQSEINQLLPWVFQRTVRPGTPIFAILQLMEELQAPSEQVLENLEVFFDPYNTPSRFVPLLASWVDLDRLLVGSPEEFAASSPTLFTSGLGRLRELIVAAAFFSKWRGSAKGLLGFLETATGGQGFEIDENVPGPGGQPRPFHILVRAPAETKSYQTLIERIIEMEKPAYVTHQLEFTE